MSDTFQTQLQQAKHRVINADIIHARPGSGGADSDSPAATAPLGMQNAAARFWLKRRSFRTNVFRRTEMPTWDRFAQAMLRMAQPTPRQVVPEIAFRLFAVFMKVMMIQRIAETSIGLFPIAQGYAVRGLIETAKEEADKKKKEEGSSSGNKDNATTTTSSNEGEQER